MADSACQNNTIEYKDGQFDVPVNLWTSISGFYNHDNGDIFLSSLNNSSSN